MLREPVWLVIEWPDGEGRPSKFLLTDLRDRVTNQRIAISPPLTRPVMALLRSPPRDRKWILAALRTALACCALVALAGCAPFRETSWAVRTAFKKRNLSVTQPAVAPMHAIHRDPVPWPPSVNARPPGGDEATGWTLVPGARGVAGHVPAPVPALAFEWDFEREDDARQGALSGWLIRHGDAELARTCGRIDPSRLPHGDALPGAIGGDYWEGTYWPGQSGECLLDTADHHVTLASPAFTLGPDNQHVSLLIGGGGAGGGVWLEVEGLPPGPERAPFADAGPGTLGMVRRDHVVPSSLFGRKARLVVQGKGHNGILIDDVAGSAGELAWKQPDGPVWGFVDLHNHLFNHLTFGGRLISGRVTERPLSGDLAAGLRTENGMRHALEDCSAHHGCFPGHVSFSLGPEAFFHDRGGYPTFDGWPKATTLIHEQVYVDWLKRAWQGGLRLIHLDVGNNAFSGQMYSEADFFLGANVFSLTDTEAVDRSLDAVGEFVAGEGRGWTEIAHSAAEARRIIARGELALVLGVEVDALGDYFTECPTDHRLFSQLEKRPCKKLCPDDEAREIKKMLDHLQARGVVHLVPIHVIENAYGYPASYGRAFDVNSEWANGKGFALRNGFADHIRFRLDDDQVDGSPLLTWAMSFLGDVRDQFDRRRLTGGPFPDERIGHTSLLGLKRAGRILTEEMMRRGMIIDVQHMSEAATDETLQMAEQAGYPLVSTHTGFRELSFGFTTQVGWDSKQPPATVAAYDTAQVERVASDALRSPEQIARIRRLGGMVGVGLTTTNVAATWGRSGEDFCDDTSTTWASSYEYAIEKLGGRGIGLGSDANGLATLPKPRFGTSACLGAQSDDFRAPLMGAMAERQRNGVRYEVAAYRMGVEDAGTGRFDHSGEAYAYTDAERDVWEGLAEAEAAREEPTLADAYRFIDRYDQRAPGRLLREAGLVRRYAKGFWVKQHGFAPELLDRCTDSCDRQDNCSDFCPGRDHFELAAYEAFPPRDGDGRYDGLPFVRTVVDAWVRMQGPNRPMHKYVVHGKTDDGRAIDRDFDVNLEGMAHYGLLPDWLQDVKNVGLDAQHLAPLFMGAEDYIEMWERAELRAAALRGRPPAPVSSAAGTGR